MADDADGVGFDFGYVVSNEPNDGAENSSIFGQKCSVPMHRSGHRMFEDNGYVYVLGGYTPGLRRPFGTLMELHALNKITETWTLVKTDGEFPGQMASMAIAQNNAKNCVFVMGGTAFPFDRHCTNAISALIRCERFDHWRWQRIRVRGNIPGPMYGHSMVYVEGDGLYVFGGTSGHEYFNRVYKLQQPSRGKLTKEMLEQEWTWFVHWKGPDDFARRYRHEMFTLKYGALIVGGGYEGSPRSMAMVLYYDIRKKKYVSLPTKADPVHGYPKKRMYQSSVRVGNIGIILGGKMGAQDIFGNYKVTGEIWSISLTNLQWKKIGQMKTPAFFHSSVASSEGTIYTFGGCLDGDGTRRTNELQKFQFGSSSLLHLAFRKCVSSLHFFVPKIVDEYDANTITRKWHELIPKLVEADADWNRRLEHAQEDEPTQEAEA
ncbi:hypothetical protein L596_019704 [Steinernema carpocapsae]|uniref:Kelch repeat protein n=1 Tax=Steinernema carpocapsae TaxID=34508 RepID=A0A4U5MRI7_STECR|nr:hypothetical protein L596_019704 [Steinernema carpocapsae]